MSSGVRFVIILVAIWLVGSVVLSLLVPALPYAGAIAFALGIGIPFLRS